MSTELVNAHDVGGRILMSPQGGMSRVTGYVEDSSALPGLCSVETEHGTLYLDCHLPVEVRCEDDKADAEVTRLLDRAEEAAQGGKHGEERRCARP